ncbi:MAG TPA: hypothetical protein VHZ95_08485 [Polyangiales bacterium]|nr:hypothetical protein [Polyangiales bacterium]
MAKKLRDRVWVSLVVWLIGAHGIACKSDRASAGDAAGRAAEAGTSSTADGGSGGSIVLAGQGASGSPAADGGGGSPAADGGSSADAGAQETPNTGTGSATGDGKSLSAIIDMHAIPGGGQDHQCVIVELPNTQAVWVNDLHATLSTGSHHLIVDRRSSDSALQTAAASCPPSMGGDDTRLLIAQQHDTRVTLPSGVAYRLEAHQRIYLQLHYINMSSAAEDIQGRVDLTLADAASGTPIEAQSLFTGALSIDVAPHSPGSVTSFLKPADSAGKVRHVFALTSHTHSLGVRATIERVASANAPASTPIHQSLDWSEPPLTLFAPPLDFNGSDGLRLTCDYQNDTDSTVMFGTDFSDEMCFMWMYYFDE